MKEYLTPSELTARYKGLVSVRTLANWRWSGQGPKFTKIGGKILYALDAVIEWESKRTIGIKTMMVAIVISWIDLILIDN